MKLLDEHQAARKAIFEYFGYVEDWRVLPIKDSRNMYWFTNGKYEVLFADSPDLASGDYYSNEIYTQRHLPKWIYEGDEYTMIVVDTHTDCNQLLQIFDNERKVDAAVAERWSDY